MIKKTFVLALGRRDSAVVLQLNGGTETSVIETKHVFITVNGHNFTFSEAAMHPVTHMNRKSKDLGVFKDFFFF